MVSNLHSIIGLANHTDAEYGLPMVTTFPPAYHHSNGSTVGGVAPLPFQPSVSSAPYDSYVTIGITDDAGARLEASGLNASGPAEQPRHCHRARSLSEHSTSASGISPSLRSVHRHD